MVTALERLWTDRCTVFVRQAVTDPLTHLTDFEETPLVEDAPCKLSFETLNAAGAGEAASVTQSVKLFLSAEAEIPAGCKIAVTRNGQTMTYSRSGLAGMFHSHQEILLEPFQEWA